MATAKKKSKAKVAKKSPVKKAGKSKAQAKVKAPAKVKAKPVQAKTKKVVPVKAQKVAKSPSTSTAKIEWARVITPLEDRIVVSVHKPAEKTAGGIIITDAGAERPNKGTVVAVGTGRRNKKGQVRPLDVQVGDEVIFADFAGTKVEVLGEEVLVLREDELLGISTL